MHNENWIKEKKFTLPNFLSNQNLVLSNDQYMGNKLLYEMALTTILRILVIKKFAYLFNEISWHIWIKFKKKFSTALCPWLIKEKEHDRPDQLINFTLFQKNKDFHHCSLTNISMMLYIIIFLTRSFSVITVHVHSKIF